MLIKIHKSYRNVVAICDYELIDKKFEEGERQLDLTGDFFKGEKKNREEIKEIIRKEQLEDSCFFIVGEKSVEVSKEVGLISEEGIKKIQNIPVALALL